MRRRRSVTNVIAALAIGGTALGPACGGDEFSSVGEVPEDARVDHDATVDADAQADSPEDAVAEGDAPVADALEDAADAKPEGGKDAAKDTGADGPGDAPTDVILKPACADGTVEQVYGPAMVGCDGAETQCAAETLCGNGWHLCTVDEYVARGGASVPASELRWLAACIRESCGVAHAPTVAVCGSCAPSTGGSAETAWTCGGQLADSDPNCWLGIRSHPTKTLRIGASAAPCGKMDMQTSSTEHGAVCCT